MFIATPGGTVQALDNLSQANTAECGCCFWGIRAISWTVQHSNYGSFEFAKPRDKSAQFKQERVREFDSGKYINQDRGRRLTAE